MQKIIRKRLAGFLQVFGFISILILMVQRREMGNAALEAVNRSAEEAARALNAARPLLTQEKLTDAEKFRRYGIIIDALQSILRWLEAIGAKTKPS